MAELSTPPLGALGARAGRYLQLMGAVASVALVAGALVWGVRLMVRDATGIPVVRAAEGPMRVAPDNPGGEVALNTGLAVNAVAAEGQAAAPEERLLIAPAAVQLAPEDMEVRLGAEAEEMLAAEVTAAPGPDAPVLTAVTEPPEVALPEGPLSADDVLALADQIAAGVEPLTPLEPLPPIATIPADVPGVAVSLRPPLRPAGVAALGPAPGPLPLPEPVAAAPVTPVEVGPPPPAGTPLIQLGAFATPDLAAAQWDMALARFPAELGPLQRLIQEGVSGGQTFYRLRALGFADMDQTRALCAVLQAAGAECIPHQVE
jgi:hypothetical protein